MWSERGDPRTGAPGVNCFWQRLGDFSWVGLVQLTIVAGAACRHEAPQKACIFLADMWTWCYIYCCDIKSIKALIKAAYFCIDKQTGKGLSNVLLAELEALGLNINECRGQGYDNGVNMKGLNQGVQAHILRLSPRAYFMPCVTSASCMLH